MPDYIEEKQRRRREAMAELYDPQWWVDNGIVDRAVNAKVGDKIVEVISGHGGYVHVNVATVTKQGRKWTSFENEPGRRYGSGRYCYEEYSDACLSDNGRNGVGSRSPVYGYLDWDMKVAHDEARGALKLAGVKFEYGYASRWTQERVIRLAEFVKDLGVIDADAR